MVGRSAGFVLKQAVSRAATSEGHSSGTLQADAELSALSHHFNKSQRQAAGHCSQLGSGALHAELT